MSKLAYATRISFTTLAGGLTRYLVERICEGVVVDRYTCSDLAAPRRNQAPWIQAVVAMANVPPAPKQSSREQMRTLVQCLHLHVDLDEGDTIAAAVALEVQP